jgi:hypothetical protein
MGSAEHVRIRRILPAVVLMLAIVPGTAFGGHSYMEGAFDDKTVGDPIGASGVTCEDCHAGPPHADERLDSHARSVACQALRPVAAGSAAGLGVRRTPSE